MPGTPLPTLFSPFTLNPLTLSNRIVMAPMTRKFASGHLPGDDMAAYYRRHAAGGAALIITECTFIDHPAANCYPNAPAFYGEALDGWRKVVDAVHAAGGRIFPQLWHAGPRRGPGSEPHGDVPAWGPMEVSQDGKSLVKAMSASDIETVVEAFATAAGDARETGFDGIELHGAHSFLIDEFLWEKTNQRHDAYGGSIEKRTRFAAEIVAAVRDTVGPDCPIAFRYSQWKQGDYEARIANTPQELEQILTPLVDAGVDIFHPSTHRYWHPAFLGSALSLAGWTRKITDKPTIAVGSVGIDTELDLAIFAGETSATRPVSVEQVEACLEREEFDLVAVGRALLGDPDWPQKIRSGQLDNIRAFHSDDLATL